MNDLKIENYVSEFVRYTMASAYGKGVNKNFSIISYLYEEKIISFYEVTNSNVCMYQGNILNEALNIYNSIK